MEKEIILNCLKGSVKQIQLDVDSIINSHYCDNFDESILSLINAIIVYINETSDDEVNYNDLIASMHEWDEYECFQSYLLTLIKISVRKGFLTGFNIKPTFHILQLQNMPQS